MRLLFYKITLSWLQTSNALCIEFLSRDIAGKTVVEVVKNVVNCLTLAKDNGRL